MLKNPLRILKTFKETIADGEGLRYSIYLAGCKHTCKGCHNAISRNPNIGELITEDIIEKIVSEINANPLLDGVTFTGGDPFFYPESLFQLMQIIKERTRQNIWCYTGYTYEEILANPALSPCLEFIDVLVDGPFIQEKYSPHISFRGSTNQRILKLNFAYNRICSLQP